MGIKYPVYRKEATDIEKKAFRDDVAQRLQILAQHYGQKGRKQVTPEQHVNNIEKLQKQLSRKWQKVLYPHRIKPTVGITFGRVQKLLNLYLKYYWVLGCVEEPPPHCPIDSNVLKYIEQPKPTWTSPLFTKEVYLMDMEKCKEKAPEKMSIAEWELRMFNDTREEVSEIKKQRVKGVEHGWCLTILNL